jgi:hypothetical protein
MVSRLAVGDIVTFSSEIIYKHTPVHATIHRKRVDLTWKDVVHSASHYGKMGIVTFLIYFIFINEILDLHTFTSSTSFSAKEMRAYLENYAAKQFLDPLNPKTWYVLQEDIMSTKVITFPPSYLYPLPH